MSDAPLTVDAESQTELKPRARLLLSLALIGASATAAFVAYKYIFNNSNLINSQINRKLRLILAPENYKTVFMSNSTNIIFLLLSSKWSA